MSPLQRRLWVSKWTQRLVPRAYKPRGHGSGVGPTHVFILWVSGPNAAVLLDPFHARPTPFILADVGSYGETPTGLAVHAAICTDLLTPNAQSEPPPRSRKRQGSGACLASCHGPEQLALEKRGRACCPQDRTWDSHLISSGAVLRNSVGAPCPVQKLKKGPGDRFCPSFPNNERVT